LDPHTAIAKAVATRHNHGDVPLVVVATAHYAKFAADVLKSLGEPADSSPSDRLDILEKLGAKPLMHRRLKETLQQDTFHKTVCLPRKQDILNELINFVDT
jgi:threonine synthase